MLSTSEGLYLALNSVAIIVICDVTLTFSIVAKGQSLLHNLTKLHFSDETSHSVPITVLKKETRRDAPKKS